VDLWGRRSPRSITSRIRAASVARGTPRSERTTNEALNVPEAFQPLADTNVFETA